MARILESIETLLNDISPVHNNLSLNVVEQPLYPDTAMKGINRFSKKIGSLLVAMEPQNQMTFSEAANQNDLSFKVAGVIPWFKNWPTPGSDGRLLKVALRIGNEFNKLESINNSTKTVTVSEGLLKDYERGTSVDLYGYPLILIINRISEGVSSSSSGISEDYDITVRSIHPIMNNDVILLEYSQVISFMEYDIKVATFKGFDTDNLYIYSLELDRKDDFLNKIFSRDPISELPDLRVINSLVYLKGFAAFESRLVRAPLILGNTQLGPFAVDFMSGSLYAFNTPIKDYMNIKLITEAGTFIHGYGTEETYQTIEKNTSVPNCISTDKMVLWDKVKGSLNFETTGLLIGIPDINNEVAFKSEINPPINLPARWRLRVYIDKKETKNVDIGIQLYPNDIVYYSIPYQLDGYEIAIESVIASEETEVVGIYGTGMDRPPPHLSFLPPGAKIGERYILDYNDYKGIGIILGTAALNYPYSTIPKFGSTFVNNKTKTFYRIVRENNISKWIMANDGNPVEKIIISSTSSYPIKFSSMLLIDSQIKDIYYQLLSHTFGKNWQGTGIIIKPLMKTLFNLRGQYSSSEYNNGYVFMWERSYKKTGKESWNYNSSNQDIVIK